MNHPGRPVFGRAAVEAGAGPIERFDAFDHGIEDLPQMRVPAAFRLTRAGLPGMLLIFGFLGGHALSSCWLKRPYRQIGGTIQAVVAFF